MEAELQELEAKAQVLRDSNVEKEARVVELKAEHARTLGAAVQPPSDPDAGLGGELEVGGVRITADILGKILGGFTVAPELASAVCQQASAREQELEAARTAAAANAKRKAAEAAGAQAGGAPAATTAGGGPSVLPTAAETEAAAGKAAGDDAMDDEELEIEEQWAKLKAFNRAPEPAEGDARPADDVVRAAFKRMFEELGTAPPKRARIA